MQRLLNSPHPSPSIRRALNIGSVAARILGRDMKFESDIVGAIADMLTDLNVGYNRV